LFRLEGKRGAERMSAEPIEGKKRIALTKLGTINGLRGPELCNKDAGGSLDKSKPERKGELLRKL